MNPEIVPYLWLGGVVLLAAGVLATINGIWKNVMKMKDFDVWMILLLAMLIVAVLGAAIMKDARWLFLAVLPCIVFAKWMRI